MKKWLFFVLTLAFVKMPLCGWPKEQLLESGLEQEAYPQMLSLNKSTLSSQEPEKEDTANPHVSQSSSTSSAGRVMWTSLPMGATQKELQIGESERWVDVGVVSLINSPISKKDNRSISRGFRPVNQLMLFLPSSKGEKKATETKDSPTPQDASLTSGEETRASVEDVVADPRLTQEEIKQLLENIKKDKEKNRAVQ